MKTFSILEKVNPESVLLVEETVADGFDVDDVSELEEYELEEITEEQTSDK